ncbi:hypothetical protein GCM10010512_05410 [Streptomyces thermoviolaceus subsp. thermoviolaceus]|nr:hypothetical protein GCM10010499_45990 [Streptomyces thermoviolaceus subsp. apingens]GHA77926.1 hypothetical protein GCM10010512_05410 [Streptomyces thermoviolaceus subsp. thermoviolaceus]
MAGRRFRAASTMPSVTRRTAHVRGAAVRVVPAAAVGPVAAVAAGSAGSVGGVVVRVGSSRMGTIIES